MGGVWAYKVLGWGGYWGWDPVENGSLIPWLCNIALLHGLLVQRVTGSLRRTQLLPRDHVATCWCSTPRS